MEWKLETARSQLCWAVFGSFLGIDLSLQCEKHGYTKMGILETTVYGLNFVHMLMANCA
jgi:hypothetical protein